MGSPLPGIPLVWAPKGVSDTLDASTSPSGSMASLVNLIPDPSTAELWQCRPAAIKLNPFTGFTTPGFVSGLLVIGNFAYGMIASGRNPGKDEPFCYNIITNTFSTISGITAANTPTSPLTTGAWNPPSLALVGSKIIVAHPGYTGAGGAFFGVLDITNPAALTWTATNTAPTALVAPPQWVVNFNGRCYFLVNPAGAQPGAYFSDVLAPTTITNANQILTFGDNVPLTCAAGLALQNQLGGIIQSLMIFKGVTNIYQVTGDYSGSTLAINTLNVATGTFAPNSLCSTEKGLIFMAPDGVRLIDFTASVSNPIGKDGEGVCIPFVFALTPSRTNAAFNAGVYRIQVQNGNAVGNPQQEWWYDFVREKWSGPHTTNTSLLASYSNTFIGTIQGSVGIWQSDQVQSSTSTFVENGVQMAYLAQTSPLPDTDQMSEIAMVETTWHMALVVANPVTCSAQDQAGTVLDTVSISPSGSPTIWGAFQWGHALWLGIANSLFPRILAWHFPIVTRRLLLSAFGNSGSGFKLGRLHMRYEVLNYLQQ